MANAAENMQGIVPADAAFAESAPGQETSFAGPISRARFLDHVDSCVRYLAAWLGGTPVASASAERARVELWRWLHVDRAALDDGTPIDFALFDAAVQRVGERLPRRGLPGQENLIQAAWLLAELTHAGTLADIPVHARAP
jgi:malate synthase